MVNLPNLLRCLPMRFRTFSCLAAFLQILEMCVLKESLKSIVMPSNFTSPSADILIPSKFKTVFSLCVLFLTERELETFLDLPVFCLN